MGITVDGGGHLLRTTPSCFVVACTNGCIVCIGLAGEPKDSGWARTRFFTYNRNGTNDYEHPRSVPFCPTRSNRVQTRAQSKL